MSDFQLYGFDERLRNLRKKHNFTQEYVAERIGVSKSTIYKYESLAMPPSLESVYKLSLLFNVSVDYLVGLNKESYFHLNGFSENQQTFMLNVIQGLKDDFLFEETKK
ncbi:helix-turn-helix domain-containing protein [Streptococcus parauberis]|uniref:helix-turn-helix domain-containing protein n=1 Tax=Streptococcus parauberis TaxID=1348 RepID=UPI0039AFA65C